MLNSMKNIKVKALLISLPLFSMTYLSYLPGPGTFIYNFRNNNSFVDIFEWLSLFLVAATLILIFFSNKIFVIWFKYFFVWFLPLAVVLIFLGGGEGILQPTYEDLAILFGEILLAVTLILALVQRFYYKR